MSAVDAYFSVFRSAPDDHPFMTVIVGDRREAVTWGRFRRMCYHLAGEMRRRGVGPGDVVLIFYPHQRWLIPAFVAAQLLGAVPSFMPPISPRQDPVVFRTSHMQLIDSLQPTLICADRATAASLGADQVPHLMLQELDGIEPIACDTWWEPIGGPAVLQHSSGTTGLKKGVVLSYEAIMAQLDGYRQALELDGTETIVSWLPVYHDMGLIAATLLPLVAGMPLIAIGALDWLMQPWRLLEEMSSAPRPLTWLPNFSFALLARTAQRAPPNLRLDHVRGFINCSEPCKPAIVDRFVEAFADRGVRQEQVQGCYAMAENVFAVSQSRLGHRVRRWTPTGAGPQTQPLLSCGRCIEGVEVEVRDDAGKRLPEGAVGELFVSGTSLFDGYRGQPELTKSKLRGGWYATGDLGAVNEGEVFVAGRSDDLIIIAGRSLYAHNVEEEVSDVAGVKPGRVCAFGADNDQSGTQDLVILAELASEGTPRVQIERAIRERLADTVLVSSAKVVMLQPDTLIKTTSGKVSRKDNRARYDRHALVSWRRGAR
jgi:acyl-CoA synthetase (AMP-forming)/AMP-acid ligase II